MKGVFYITSRQFCLKRVLTGRFIKFISQLPAIVGFGASLCLTAAFCVAFFVLTGAVLTVQAADIPAETGDKYQQLRLAEPIVQPIESTLRNGSQGLRSRKLVNRRALGASDKQIVAVQLKAGSVSALVGRSVGAITQRRAEIESSQSQFLGRARTGSLAGMRVIGQVSTVLNAVFIEVDSDAAVELLARDPAVARVVAVPNYRLSLFNRPSLPANTISYVGANTFRWLGVTGRGVTVAVVDTGIDYTHLDLGGSGSPADYVAAFGSDIADSRNTTLDGLFPTAKVIAGYDFLGDVWPQGPVAPDPDPIDGQGHGTSAAAIIGGTQGVAPDVKFIAIKACATANLECPGFALVQALEFALDPNGDGDFSDRADIINWSLGRPYGQPFDDLLSTAVDAASAMGVLSVAAAGNEADRPYVVNSPGSAPTALSVAETHVPASRLQNFSVNSQEFSAVLQLWSDDPQSVVSGILQYGDGAGGNLDGCQPFAENAVNGRVVLVDRGTCATAQKMHNVARGGGILGFIGLIDETEAFTTANVTDGPVTMPSYVVDLVTATQMKALLGQTVTLDPRAQKNLSRYVVGTSARGPQHDHDVLIKPDMAAPGGLLAARAGFGDGRSRFGGTSGAAPVVSGAAALIRQIRPDATVAQLKARLMNSAESELLEMDGEFAPVSRVGSGELRTTQAMLMPVVAWEEDTGQASLSFGLVEAADPLITLEKHIVLTNSGYRAVSVQGRPRFRVENDAQSSAVSVEVSPTNFTIAPGGEQRVLVRMTIQSSFLPDNAMSSGIDGINGNALSVNEFDGFIDFWMSGGRRSIQLPWHVLPRKSARLTVAETETVSTGVTRVGLENTGVGTAQLEAFTLLATSPDLPDSQAGTDMPTPDLRAVGIRTLPIGPGFCAQDASFLINIAINSWARQELLAPVSYAVLVDLDPAPTPDSQAAPDFVIFNSGQLISGQFDARQLTWVENVSAGLMSANFFTEHATHTANTILTVCAEQIGLTAADFGRRQMRITVLAQDVYFSGPGDIIENIVVTPGAQQYVGAVTADIPGLSQGAIELRDLKAIPNSGFPSESAGLANTPELGLMLFTNGDRGEGFRGGATASTEMLILSPPSRATNGLNLSIRR